MIKSLNNSSKDIKLIKKYDSYFSPDVSRKINNHSANKLIYNNYNHQYNNLKRNNKKSVINLRKKIIFDKKMKVLLWSYHTRMAKVIIIVIIIVIIYQ